MGGQMRYNSEVSKINTEGGGFLSRAKTTGVTLQTAPRLTQTLCSNGDYAHLFETDRQVPQTVEPRRRVRSMKYSMSVVIYFNFKMKQDSTYATTMLSWAHGTKS